MSRSRSARTRLSICAVKGIRHSIVGGLVVKGCIETPAPHSPPEGSAVECGKGAMSDPYTSTTTGGGTQSNYTSWTKDEGFDVNQVGSKDDYRSEQESSSSVWSTASC